MSTLSIPEVEFLAQARLQHSLGCQVKIWTPLLSNFQPVFFSAPVPYSFREWWHELGWVPFMGVVILSVEMDRSQTVFKPWWNKVNDDSKLRTWLTQSSMFEPQPPLIHIPSLALDEWSYSGAELTGDKIRHSRTAPKSLEVCPRVHHTDTVFLILKSHLETGCPSI